ncbi:MAG: PP0621 family protein [Methylophilaceae bacterium]
MARILLLIVLIWILYHVFKRIIAGAESRAKMSETSTNKDIDNPEKIVLCSQCGLHIPENESHVMSGLIYCNNPNCQPKDSEK